MNYRHAFHAGNFADLAKHACLTALMERLTAGPGPLTVIDTHAGAGAYDLSGEMSRKSGEAERGVARLMRDEAAPEAFDVLKAAVARANPDGEATLYPGSPALVVAALREDDRYIACELRPDDHALLAQLLAPTGGQGEAVMGDGFEAAATRTPKGPTLVLIDPPFERADDYARSVAATAAVLKRNPAAVVAIWTPIKDLETFDAFLRDLEGVDPPPTLVAEARLQPLTDPMRMNGCAMVVVGAPDLADEMRAVCGWVVSHLGEKGGEARIWTL
ncbi:23S rRNA (adenine(2030)-N(6))-methyltransferase RlmJ [Caulobacter sp. CCUG 60055]|uniref:23S rRNA (adenine(2030)-N(6))-methyltransferase RlmJ n=1 Tax=Caulobacter sp. CCUG 60055 TaxID=2100090 RepID=UPI001FA76E38|nr:23S rRNA (adenine(2030)-N(6))-methyltransferase RlmJ [Caulobacter sp. CCUG 60055]